MRAQSQAFVPATPANTSVIPAKAGIHVDIQAEAKGNMDPGFRRDDGTGGIIAADTRARDQTAARSA